MVKWWNGQKVIGHLGFDIYIYRLALSFLLERQYCLVIESTVLGGSQSDLNAGSDTRYLTCIKL